MTNMGGMNGYIAPSLRAGNGVFEWGTRTYVMGIINVSLESFSGDGLDATEAAAEQARRFEADGADILDVGGQSTRPGFDEISIDEELRRVVPAIEAVRRVTTMPVSIDAYRAPVVEAALDAGANLINDIWGFRHDAGVARVAAQRAAPAVVMHNQRGRQFHDVIGDVETGLRESLRIAEEAGLDPGMVIVDPGFGFGWTEGQNLEMLRRLEELKTLRLPILVGTSRKSTIGAVLDLPVEERLLGTAATVALAVANGADIVRVHDVAEMVQVCRMTDAVLRGKTTRVQA